MVSGHCQKGQEPLLTLSVMHLKNGDPETAEKKFNEYLRRTISIRDTAVRKEMKENYYHGILLGLLSFKDSWDIASNRNPVKATVT